MIYNTSIRLVRRRKHTRGVVIVWTLISMLTMMAFSALVIDMGWLYYRRDHIQAAADAAALAGDLSLKNSGSYSTATGVATAIAEDYGYQTSTTNPGTTDLISFTPQGSGNLKNYTNGFTITIQRTENMFFGYFVGNYRQKLQATATANYQGYADIAFDPRFQGEAFGMPFALVAYGPDQGATRGDAIDTRWNDLDGSFTKTHNPYNWNATTQKNLDAGVNYFLNISSTFATSSANPNKNNKVMVQIFDPQLSVGYNGDPTPFDQYVTTSGAGAGSGQSPTEQWRYTIYAVNNDGVKTQVATAVFGESSADTVYESMWVTPSSFIFDPTAYPGDSFILNVRTDDGSGNPGVGLDKNGFQLRAGPDLTNPASGFSSDVSALDSNGNYVMGTGPTVGSSTYDDAWNAAFSSFTGGPLVQMGAQTYLPVTAYNDTNATAGNQIYFGYIGSNPNANQPTIITFNGFDEDSGATGITYESTAYPGVVFTGILGNQPQDNNGNGVWSPAGPQNRGTSDPTTPSNTVYFPPGTYLPGNWTAYYNTGKEDTSTWTWSVNFESSNNSTAPQLIYTVNQDGTVNDDY